MYPGKDEAGTGNMKGKKDNALKGTQNLETEMKTRQSLTKGHHGDKPLHKTEKKSGCKGCVEGRR